MNELKEQRKKIGYAISTLLPRKEERERERESRQIDTS